MGGPGTDSEKTRCVFHCQKYDQIVVGVSSIENAIEVGEEFAKQGVESVELCAYFNKEKKDTVEKGLKGKIRVGAVRFD